MAGPTDFRSFSDGSAVSITSVPDTTEAEKKFNNKNISTSNGRVWKAVLVTSAVIAAVAAIAAGVLFFVLAMPVAAGVAIGVSVVGLAGVTVSLVANRANKEMPVDFRVMCYEEAIEDFNYFTQGYTESQKRASAVPYKCEGDRKYKVLYLDPSPVFPGFKVDSFNSEEQASKFFNEKMNLVKKHN